MSVKPASSSVPDSVRPGEGARLKSGAIGVVGVVFMVVAFSAPTTAMTGNLPVAVGYGNGIGAPAGFIIATIVLTIFSVGFVALARHITAAGAFYTFVARGWSKIMGLPAGVMSMVTYMTMEAALLGIFSVYCDQLVNKHFGIDGPWELYALIGLLVIAALSHFDISVAAKVLGVVLLGELGILTLTGVSVLAQGGGPDGIIWTGLNPLSGLSTNGLAGGVVGLGLLFAFWSWVGFESTAIYGEESRDPKRVVPQATLVAVIGIGVFYTFVSWTSITANGADRSIELATSDNPFELLYSPTRVFVGEWGVVVFETLVVLGSFACALAIHNSAARYLFAFGRDGLLPSRLGHAHPEHKSPWVASLAQSFFALVVLIGCSLSGTDPYGELFVLVAIMATICLLTVQTLCSISVVVYFHVKRQHPETAHWLRTLVCPIVGGLGMVYVIYLLLSNLEVAAGAAAETLFFRMIPWIVAILLFGSMLVALVLRRTQPAQYAKIGRTIFDEPAHVATARSGGLIDDAALAEEMIAAEAEISGDESKSGV